MDQIVPKKAKDAVKCSKGGKHIPTTKEGKSSAGPIKWDECTKCGFRLSGN